MMWLLFFIAAAAAQELPRGKIIDALQCADDASQSYALYLPSNYVPDKEWSVIFAFDPGGRGLRPVERYQAAAEKYGYIVAGSNNSRNGPMDVSIAAVKAMTLDVNQRFAINQKRVYTAGMSGGARVAMLVALSANGRIAGVIASSAGFPDSKPRKTIPFALYGTAGTEDFNYREMRGIERVVTSPHHIEIFQGGHVWLSSELAMEAVEWMELQAMRSGIRARDEVLIETIFAKKADQVASAHGDVDAYLALSNLVNHLDGLKDVANFATRANLMKQRKPVKDALKKDREMLDREERELSELVRLEMELRDRDKREETLHKLREKFGELARRSAAPSDSRERQYARRLLRGAAMAGGGQRDPALRKLLDDLTIPTRPGAQ